MRVNDYNPLLLMLWQANIDIQFVVESSLALAHYVSGYVTKAERSNMQEIWQEVSENKSVYSGLWSFGVRSLRFRECGLYEASDLLLGDHLNEKSDTVKWVDVSLPHKRCRRLMDHKVLLEMAEHNPDTEEILRTTFLTPTIHRDQQGWKMFVSTTLWQTMIGMPKIVVETGSIQSSINLGFQTTNSLIQRRKHREKTITTP